MDPLPSTNYTLGRYAHTYTEQEGQGENKRSMSLPIRYMYRIPYPDEGIGHSGVVTSYIAHFFAGSFVLQKCTRMIPWQAFIGIP